VDERVRTAILRLDEAEALGGIEPLNGTSLQSSSLFSAVHAAATRYDVR
jgi:hypothetical protein